jgi:NADH dehydrogenase [ubiquinone] 1 alpha subcomplex assembly factor 5
VSSLHLHQVNNLENRFEEILTSLTPDGAMIGNTLGPRTLDELRISYVLAENERYGGLSPHVLPLIDIADLGNLMGHCRVAIPSIFKYECKCWVMVDEIIFETPMDLLSTIQSIGENSSLMGSRKGSYRDLLIAMMAIYSNLFAREIDGKQCITSTIELVNFVGWRYSEKQRQPLKRGSQDVHLGKLLEELQEEGDGDIEYGTID